MNRRAMGLCLLGVGLAACDGGHTWYHNCPDAGATGGWYAYDLELVHYAPNCPLPAPTSGSHWYWVDLAGQIYDHNEWDMEVGYAYVYNSSEALMAREGAYFQERNGQWVSSRHCLIRRLPDSTRATTSASMKRNGIIA